MDVSDQFTADRTVKKYSTKLHRLLANQTGGDTASTATDTKTEERVISDRIPTATHAPDERRVSSTVTQLIGGAHNSLNADGSSPSPYAITLPRTISERQRLYHATYQRKFVLTGSVKPKSQPPVSLVVSPQEAAAVAAAAAALASRSASATPAAAVVSPASTSAVIENPFDHNSGRIVRRGSGSAAASPVAAAAAVANERALATALARASKTVTISGSGIRVVRGSGGRAPLTVARPRVRPPPQRPQRPNSTTATAAASGGDAVPTPIDVAAVASRILNSLAPPLATALAGRAPLVPPPAPVRTVPKKHTVPEIYRYHPSVMRAGAVGMIAGEEDKTNDSSSFGTETSIYTRSGRRRRTRSRSRSRSASPPVSAAFAKPTIPRLKLHPTNGAGFGRTSRELKHETETVRINGLLFRHQHKQKGVVHPKPSTAGNGTAAATSRPYSRATIRAFRAINVSNPKAAYTER